ncbi:PREDICTED: translation initiation factor IF-2-like [Calidris pugnax]|uniref:translation initiation factor IF-2-like n=1 Tax=Calidris pugnax TaxID=198806 RepID=UPI00071C5649|nr:PREDICTED: translation initiation factor IF-2-like [Calidris pugnax]
MGGREEAGGRGSPARAARRPPSRLPSRRAGTTCGPAGPAPGLAGPCSGAFKQSCGLGERNPPPPRFQGPQPGRRWSGGGRSGAVRLPPRPPPLPRPLPPPGTTSVTDTARGGVCSAMGGREEAGGRGSPARAARRPPSRLPSRRAGTTCGPAGPAPGLAGPCSGAFKQSCGLGERNPPPPRSDCLSLKFPTAPGCAFGRREQSSAAERGRVSQGSPCSGHRAPRRHPPPLRKRFCRCPAPLPHPSRAATSAFRERHRLSPSRLRAEGAEEGKPGMPLPPGYPAGPRPPSRRPAASSPGASRKEEGGENGFHFRLVAGTTSAQNILE